tara:strand:+ start:28 stop:564 length:537 start_codon:yes stop_codon:yes gene_type:complete
MKFLLKITIGALIFIGCLVGIFMLGISYDNYEESKFYNIKTPKNLNLEKTVEFYNNQKLDSLNKLNVKSEKLIILGKGYSGYEFFMWHKPTEKGEIYLKAFEITQNIELSKEKLEDRTKNRITELSENYKMYKGSSIIYEGTFEKYYPARFELWFKSEKTGIEEKLVEKSYLIDGWDR